ncbi:hypothetical protein AK812_SmicGene11252 [Symbiodinium microadriaticum]|uniref:Uncharacterized protein n=1 Tax=Symbiodinium microadriaticum TaxID=2951 RepID=A0A1Q9EDP3_SYMMI|nr:hypothetical protein AK812_SmicGene11252 [Symbiodinium microadriaticum]
MPRWRSLAKKTRQYAVSGGSFSGRGRPRTVAVWQDGQIKQWSTTRGLEAHRFQTSAAAAVFLQSAGQQLLATITVGHAVR